MGSLAEVQQLIEAYRWIDARNMLEDILQSASGMERYYALWKLSQTQSRLFEYEAGKASLEQSLAFAADHGITPNSQALLYTAMQWEDLGQPERAVEVWNSLRAQGAAGEQYSWIWRRIDYAISILRVVERYNVTVVPVGQNCLPAALAVRWGFNTVRMEGPFTAGVFNRDGVSMALEDDFAHFHDPKAFKVHPTEAGILSASLARYYTIFNHELGPWWVDDDCRRIRDLYTRRIETFLQGMRSDAVLCVCTRINPMNVERLYQGLKARLKPGGRMRLLVLDFLANNPVDPATLTEPDNVRVVPTAYPGPDYVWHMRNHFDTPGGFGFEQVIVDAMLDEFLKLRPL